MKTMLFLQPRVYCRLQHDDQVEDMYKSRVSEVEDYPCMNWGCDGDELLILMYVYVVVIVSEIS